MAKAPNRYQAILAKIFEERFTPGSTDIPFSRDELPIAAADLKIELPRNLGDVIYALRYRTPFPAVILAKQPEGYEWTIVGRGRSQYAFVLGKINRIEPNPALALVKIPDSTPEIITAYAQSDEQALLAKVRYNRLIDIFLSVAAYSLQSHLRTTVADYGQIEIDEVYVGVDKQGRQFIIPVQAKGGKDRHSVVQTKQDMLFCEERYPSLICRAVSAQFMENELIAMFELGLEDGKVVIQQERHYRLCSSGEIEAEDLARYGNASG
jgi:hypothetical protein